MVMHHSVMHDNTVTMHCVTMRRCTIIMRLITMVIHAYFISHYSRDVPIIGLAIISVADMLHFYYIGIGTVCLESRYCYTDIVHAKIFLFNACQEERLQNSFYSITILTLLEYSPSREFTKTHFLSRKIIVEIYGVIQN